MGHGGRLTLVVLLATCLVSSAVKGQSPAQNASARTAFERLSSEIRVLGPGEFISGFRESRALPARDESLLRELSRILESRRWGARELRPLLSHPDARVRTLALIALYNLEDPQLLPDIFGSVNDDAVTFPALQPFSMAGFGDSVLTPDRLRSQTVGDVAAAILKVYMETGGYFYGPFGQIEQPGFTDYWKARANRSSTAGWWSVRLARAGHATSPTPESRYGAIRALRADIDRLREPERTYVLLWLHGDSGSDALVAESELTVLMQRLGPEALLDLLRRRIRTNDPDLQPRRSGTWPYARMCLFVLQHARDLLRPVDAQALLDQEQLELMVTQQGFEPLRSPWWAIAAGDLQSPGAVAILTSARGRFMGEYDIPNRLELTEALWRLGGEPHVLSVVDWFYTDVGRAQFNNGGVAGTMDKLLRTSARRNRLLARTFIEDPRFDTLNWKSLEVLAKAMNGWNDRAVVPPADFATVYSPLGIDFFDHDRSKALQQYPKEIGSLVDSLARWRRAMRDNVALLQEPALQ